MPYTPVPTRADGDILTASYLNLLAANQEFLYGLAQSANIPFNSFSASLSTMTSADATWYIRHRLPFFHWKVTTADASGNDSLRVFYNGVKIAGYSDPPGSVSGVYDLRSWAGLPNLQGAWATATSYDADNNGDGDVVTQSGQYYRCKQNHTSAASNQPGVGASWTTYWELLTLPGVGTMCVAWITFAKSPAATITVNYLLETDSVTL
jgi:hypothetical protein